VQKLRGIYDYTPSGPRVTPPGTQRPANRPETAPSAKQSFFSGFSGLFDKEKTNFPSLPRLFLVELYSWLAAVLVVVPFAGVVLTYAPFYHGVQSSMGMVSISRWITGAFIFGYIPRLAWILTRNMYYTMVGSIILLFPGVLLLIASQFLAIVYALLFRLPA